MCAMRRRARLPVPLRRARPPLPAWLAGGLLALALPWAAAEAGTAAPAATAAVAATPAPGAVQAEPLLDAREAWRKRDRARLAALRTAVLASRHPLAMWVDYWDLNLRLPEATVPEVEAFYARWPGTYVEDRLRNDWLLELGRRKDWAAFAADRPRFRMNDDRDVVCYGLLIEQQAGREVRDAARAAWLAQRDADEGCAAMAATLFEARQFGSADVWAKARAATDTYRPRAVRQALALLGPSVTESLDEVLDNPARYLARKAAASPRAAAELTTLALMRLAASDVDAAEQALQRRWDAALPSDLAGWAWATLAKWSALKLLPEAPAQYDRAERHAERHQPRRDVRDALRVDWTDDTIAWRARALLRQAATGDAAGRGVATWEKLLQTLEALSPGEQKDPAWRYWKARALQVTALEGRLPVAQADLHVAQARALQETLAGELSFYGALAAEDIGRRARMPASPAPLSAEERVGAVRNAGLERGLQLIGIGLRSEGVREWNFSLRGLGERELLAAAQWACDREVWDRCITASERTVDEVDLAQRYPTPFRREVVARTREIGLDAAYVYGLMRQESRFVMDARSHVGASGLMQLMPATARWTANKIGLPYSADLINDRDTNLLLGTSYLKLVLDDQGGSQALGAAAYNAGPNRLKRWRDGPRLETAVWVENIPFNETRDYVKKVLSNALYYAARLGHPEQPLRGRLGPTVGPREVTAATVRDLP
ncbi:soluble lytic murein transglycosylase precursor [Piscinibacter sakaiensis]|uniref:Soluble lytic murein transglycosylase n=1 Tax=Piscinibacter sakaiensis TaxID=1547922 RepID=A0A0K8P4Q7_PISS1|nr:soluble lytic murein transglycosylase precursor [Piscinibacter sakaiensis]